MKAVSAPTKVELGELGEARIETPGASHATLRGLLRLRWGLGAAAVLVLIVLSAALAPWISPHDPLAVNIRHRLAPPAWMEGGTPEHLLGTDQVGPRPPVAHDLRWPGFAGRRRRRGDHISHDRRDARARRRATSAGAPTGRS